MSDNQPPRETNSKKQDSPPKLKSTENVNKENNGNKFSSIKKILSILWIKIEFKQEGKTKVEHTNPSHKDLFKLFLDIDDIKKQKQLISQKQVI